MWEKAKIIDVCEILGGKPAPTDLSAYNLDGIPFVRMRDLGRYHLTTNLDTTDEKIAVSYANTNNLKPIPRGAILIPRSGSVALNHRAILGTDSIIVSHICALVVKDSNRLNNHFLYYWLCRYDMNKIAKRTTGLDAITFNDLGNITISFPNLETQNKIVAILNKAQAILDKREKTITKYKELLRATFGEMFGEVDSSNRFPLKKIGEAIKLFGGYAFKSTEFQKKGIPVIKIGTVNKGYFDTSTLSFIPKNKFKLYTKYSIVPNDILITLTGTTGKDDFANVYSIEAIYDTYLLNQRVAKFEIDESKYNNYFVRYLFMSPKTKKLLQAKSRGARQANISTEDIEALELINPPIKLQNEFGKKAENIHKIFSNVKLLKKQSEILLKSLSQQVFNERIIIDVDTQLEALTNAIDLDKQDEENEIGTISNDITFVQRLIDRLNEQEFENKNQYDKAKYILFRIMKEEDNLVKQIIVDNKVHLTLQNETA